ncbi:MAG TPA: hypothetical protein VIN38_08450 [Thiobacillus sp.]
MSVDQAAGLRRRTTSQQVRCIHCFFDSPTASARLAQALHDLGQVSLLVDLHGRLFSASATRSLFDWKHQLAYKQLNTLPQLYGDGWLAPGLRLDTADLLQAWQAYDFVILDAGPIGNTFMLLQDTHSPVIAEVQPGVDSPQRVFRLLKTLSQEERPVSIGLLGDTANCDQVLAACSHFFEQSFTQTVYSVALETDAFAALAVRMTHEETHRLTRCT